MDKDKPAAAQLDARVQPTTSKEGETQERGSVQSPNIVVEENDELPALVISDSEEEEPAAVEAVKEKAHPASQSKLRDISGITPLDVSVDANTESVLERYEKSMHGKNSKASSSSEVLVCENIDLTETSEAEESLVSDEGREISGKSEVNSTIKEVKDTASMTAQELLQSLLGLQEEGPAFSGKKAGKPGAAGEEKVQSIECSDLIRFNDQPLEQQPTKDELDEAVQQNGTKSVSPVESCVVNSSSLNDATSSSVGMTLDGEKKCKDSSNAIEVEESQQKPENGDKAVSVNNTRQDSVGAESPNGELDESTSLLEEMDDPTANEKDLEDDQQDGNSLSSAESASTAVEVTAKLPNGDDVEAMVTSTNEIDDLTAATDEPPRKRARSSESAESAVRTDDVQSPIVNRDDDSDSNSTIPWEASGDELGEECSSKGESVVPQRMVQSQSSSRRNSSSPSIEDATVKNGTLSAGKAIAVGVSAESARNATDAGEAVKGKSNSNSENMTAKPVQFLDVLVIDDDDEDEDDDCEDDEDEIKTRSVNQKRPSKSASLEAAAVGAKRARENDTTDDTKRQKMDNSFKTDGNAAAPAVKSTSIELEFMRKFAKPIRKMTRDDLEEFVMQKVCQVLLYESEIAKLHKRVNTVEGMMQVFKQRLSDANSQYNNLKLVHDRTVIELKKKYNRFMPPVKVTRTVGLQVNGPSVALHVLHEMAGGSGCVSVDKIAQPVGGLTVIPIPETQQSYKGEKQASGSAVGSSTPTSNNHHPIVQNMMPTAASMNYAYVHNSIAGNLSIQPTDTNSSQNGTIVEPIPSCSGFSSSSRPVANSINSNSNSSSSSSGSSITSSNGNASASTFDNAVAGPSGIRKVNTAAPSSKTANSVSSEGNRGTSSGSGTARKKTVHKFTPMRPPLSASEQEQQEQLALQHQERLMQEIQSQQAQIAKLVAISKENRGENSATKTQAPSSSSHSRQATATPQPSSSSSASSSPVVSNVRPNKPSSATATASATTKQPRPAPPAQQQTRSSPAMVESLIDLTEEEEPPNNNFGATAALSARIRSRVGHNGTAPHPQPSTSQSGPHGAAAAAAVAASQMGRLKQLGNKEKHRTGGNTTVLSMNATASTSGLARNGSGTAPHSVRSVYTKSSQGLKLRLIGPAPPPAPQWVHPAPLPQPGPQELKPEWKPPPPAPSIRINNVPTGIVISWSMPETVDLHATIENYEIYAYQETSAPPSTKSWRLVGDVKALPLPMAVTLTHFNEGQRYHFAVRAIDEYNRFGEYSDARTWSEVNGEQPPEFV